MSTSCFPWGPLRTSSITNDDLALITLVSTILTTIIYINKVYLELPPESALGTINRFAVGWGGYGGGGQWKLSQRPQVMTRRRVSWWGHVDITNPGETWLTFQTASLQCGGASGGWKGAWEEFLKGRVFQREEGMKVEVIVIDCGWLYKIKCMLYDYS